MKGAPVQVKEGIEENRECFQSSVTHEPARGGAGVNSLHPEWPRSNLPTYLPPSKAHLRR